MNETEKCILCVYTEDNEFIVRDQHGRRVTHVRRVMVDQEVSDATRITIEFFQPFPPKVPT